MQPHQFFRLLSDETRLRCLLLVARHGSQRVCDITLALEESYVLWVYSGMKDGGSGFITALLTIYLAGAVT